MNKKIIKTTNEIFYTIGKICILGINIQTLGDQVKDVEVREQLLQIGERMQKTTVELGRGFGRTTDLYVDFLKFLHS